MTLETRITSEIGWNWLDSGTSTSTRTQGTFQRQLAFSALGNTGVDAIWYLENASIPAGANVLLEDLSNLLANEMYEPAGGGINAVRRELSFLIGKCENLTVVTNEVFSGGADYDDESLRYMRTLADLNRELAAQADLVVEVVCGLPNVLKGELP